MTSKVDQAVSIIASLDLPRAQQNERSALCLLALLNLLPDGDWSSAEAPLMGVTPIMNWVRAHYGREYAPNTRETFRRQTLHQFVRAGVVQRNPDRPDRPVNSPHTVYQVAPPVLHLLRSYGTNDWHSCLTDYLARSGTLASEYARERARHRVPVRIEGDRQMALRERLAREKRLRGVEVRAQKLLAIGERCAQRLGPGPAAKDHGDVLYDERGRPR